ncbi:hypothetical protein MMC30_009223 [Trapelia coarctata]|nr:hypothetical protein [Trapelia coarctata]
MTTSGVQVFDGEIAKKWKAEGMANSDNGMDISQVMVDWVIEELRYKAKLFQQTGTVSVFNGDVVKSDSAIPESLKKALQAAVAPLEQVLEVYKDYHPGTNETVLNLVHPSLFPLIYGRSRILTDKIVRLEDCIARCGEGIISAEPPEDQLQNESYSRNFQWLPCEVEWTGNGGSMKITSYINNLHPYKHKELYEIIAEFLSRTIPLWNQTLTPLKNKGTYQRITLSSIEYDMDEDNVPEGMGPPRDWDSDDDDADQIQDDFNDWLEENKQSIQPEPGLFTPPPALKPEEMVDLQRDFGKKGLQVIVKLANILLTPEKPEYAGGEWHVEGQLNEHICATALYYYDSANITENRLAFRQDSETEPMSEFPYKQNDHKWLSEIFGVKNDGLSVQEVGDVVCKEGRLLTWPNILQHRVSAFQLADVTKPGHRKILALFLVDPNIRVISTANVPPQQRHWWAEEVAKTGALASLSAEIREHVIGEVEEFPIGMAEAKEFRLRLMKERSFYVDAQNGFSICEY